MYKKLIIVVAISVILSSCVSLPVYHSINESEFDKETIYSGYDTNSRLRWLVSNDSLNLYIRLDTENPTTIKKIVNLGIKIQIDTTAKKNEGMFLNYPIFETDQLSRKDKKRVESNINNLNERTVKLGLMLQKTSSTVKFIKEKKIHIFNAYDKDADVTVELKADDNGNLQYFTKIPFNLISNTKFNIFSLGINIDGFDIDMQDKQNEKNNNNIFNSNADKRKGRHSSETSSFEHRPELAKDIDIWFKVNLTN